MLNMLKSDQPINKIEDDLLDRNIFVEQLGNAIKRYKQTDSLTIGLCGSWGSGKTSILNMLENSLQKCNKSNETIIVRFEPWLISNQEQMIYLFLKQIAKQVLNIDVNNKKIKEIGQKLDEYAGAFKILQFIPNVGVLAMVLEQTLKLFGKGMKSYAANKEKDLQEIKNDIISKLSNISNKIVIIIDDIDRLNCEEIKTIFQMVKCIADFPNTIYVLSFDREVVTKALEKVQEGNGDHYMQKILQISITVPVTDHFTLQQIFQQKLQKIIADLPPEKFNQDYWNTMFQYGIAKHLTSLRIINRILNIFTFKYNLLKNDVNCIDLLALVTLECIEPKAFEILSKYENEFCGMWVETKKENPTTLAIRNACQHIFDKINSDNLTSVQQLLSLLFPRVRGALKYKHIGFEYNDDLYLAQQQLASKNHFNTYFNLQIATYSLSISFIEEILLDKSKDTNNRYENINKKNQIGEFYYKATAVIINNNLTLTTDNIQKILENIAVFTERENYLQTESVIQLYDSRKSLIKALLNKISNSNLQNILEDIFKNQNISLNILACILYETSAGYDRYTSSEYNKTLPKLVDLSFLIHLEELFIKHFDDNHKILAALDDEHFQFTLHLLDIIKPEIVDEMIRAAQQDTYIMAKLISSQINISASDRNNFWYKDNTCLSKYNLDIDVIYKNMLEFSSSSDFNKLLLWQKYGICAFLLLCNTQYKSTTREEIQKMLSSLPKH